MPKEFNKELLLTYYSPKFTSSLVVPNTEYISGENRLIK